MSTLNVIGLNNHFPMSLSICMTADGIDLLKSPPYLLEKIKKKKELISNLASLFFFYLFFLYIHYFH